MIKLVLLIVAATLYLNPLYPVYAESDSNSAMSKPPINTARLAEEKMRLASKEAEIRNKMEDKREKIASRVGEMKEKHASRAAYLKEKLAKFKDQVKAQRVEKVSENLQTINSNRSKMMTTHLEMLTKILNTIEDKVNEGATAGKNVDSAKSAISTARTAIEKASTAVSTQKTEDYAIEVNSETTVKADATAARDTLLKDLKSNVELIKQAREAVSAALKAAKEVLGVAATPTASV